MVRKGSGRIAPIRLRGIEAVAELYLAGVISRDGVIGGDNGRIVADGRTFVGWDSIPARLAATSRNDKPIFIGIADEVEE